MKEIRLSKTLPRVVGNVRVSDEIYDRLKKVSEERGVSMAEVIRAIVESFIDECNFS